MFLPVVPASGVFDFCMRIKKRAGSFAELPCRALMGLKEHCGLSASGAGALYRSKIFPVFHAAGVLQCACLDFSWKKSLRKRGVRSRGQRTRYVI